MWGSTRQTDGYEDMMDYYMSEKFGLDWKEYDQSRMKIFREIMTLNAEREEKENKKSNRSQQGYGR